MKIDVRTLFTFQRDGSVKDRLLTALLVLAGALLFSIAAKTLSFGPFLAVAFTVGVSLVCCFEVARLFARDAVTLRYRPVAGAIAFLILFAPTVFAGWGATGMILVEANPWVWVHLGAVISVLGLMIFHIFSGRRDLDMAGADGARWFPAFALVSLCGPELVLLSGLPFGVSILWWMVAVVALNDAAAYFVGRSFGRIKLAPALSPNKTIEGSAAGLVVGSLAGCLFWQPLLGIAVPCWDVLWVSALACLAAQTADLSKSYLKRLRGVKDTGAFFPGHGGMLDRFDGLIGAAPVVVAALVLWRFW